MRLEGKESIMENNFRHNTRLWRMRKGLSLRAICELLGLSEKTVRQMETSGALHRLKKLLGIRFNRQDILDAAGETEVSYRPRDVQALRMEIKRLKVLYRQRLTAALEDWKEVSEDGQRMGAPHNGRGPEAVPD